MRPTGEARFGIAALLTLQLLTSMAGVTLLARMAPAVDRILQENVYSTEAVEAMLAAVASGDEAAYQDALERAAHNITEVEEQPLLEALRASGPRALASEGPERQEVVRDLRTLGDVNRASMREADQSARLLGLAGAWAMALLGFAGFLVSLVVYRRVEERLIVPITEVDAVLASARAGDDLRRCTRAAVSPRQDRLAENLNWLLDRRRAPQGTEVDEGLTRAVVLEVLDRVGRPAWVLGSGGRVLAANKLALEMPGASPWSGPPSALDDEGAPRDGWSVTEIGSVRLVEGAAPPELPG